ncbi:MAG TPA: glycine cleavage T C-terminal barrel domain-containing protein [Methylomirabilota bacterium]|nr:glycine cleavage T C-terminal barrel domain-containing protein [Methylomirabilota bacterium]
MIGTDAKVQYAAARSGVGLVDRRDLGVLEATGRDRATFLNALLSNDVKSLVPGQGCAATLLDIHGKVQFVLFVWALDDRLLLVTPPGAAAATLEALDKYLFSEKVALRDASEDWALLLLAGPQAPLLAGRLTGAAPDARPWSHVAARLDGVDVRLVRGRGETGEPEVWIAAPAADAERVWKALVEAGATVVGAEALDSLRIEAGTPRFPEDIGPTVLLPEVPSAGLVSHTKGCYPGQEVVVRIRDRGHVNRHLRGLVLQGDRVPPPGSEVLAGDGVVGAVTSAARSLGLGRPLALALVRREHAAAGTALAVRVDGALLPATVSDLPFTR